MEWEVWSLSTIGPNRYHPLVRPLQPGDKHILGWAGQGPAAHAVLSSAPRVLWPGSGCRRSLGTPLLTVAPPPIGGPSPCSYVRGQVALPHWASVPSATRKGIPSTVSGGHCGHRGS